MRLHCEVEVVSRHLPALGLRNRGKGVRAVLSLCQQAPRTPPGPRAGGERGGRHPACLLISTLKDKRGTRYEVRGAGDSGVAARRSCPKRPTVSPAGLRLGGSERPAPEPHHHPDPGVSLPTRRRKDFESHFLFFLPISATLLIALLLSNR